MGRNVPLLAALALAGLLTAVSGCAGARSDPGAAATPTPTTSPGPASPGSVTPTGPATGPATPVRVVLRKTGGFVGVDEQLEVETDGAWTFTTVDGIRQPGRLSADQVTTLHRLAATPALADEARRKGGGVPCNDGFVYTLSAGSLTMSVEQCGGAGNLPTFQAIVTLLTDATPI